MCINNGDWSNKLSMFNGDNEIISPNLDSGILTVQLEYFDYTIITKLKY